MMNNCIGACFTQCSSFQHYVSVILCMHMFMGLLAWMVNAMGSHPLCQLEAWGCDSMVSEPQVGNNGPLWAKKEQLTEVVSRSA